MTNASQTTARTGLNTERDSNPETKIKHSISLAKVSTPGDFIRLAEQVRDYMGGVPEEFHESATIGFGTDTPYDGFEVDYLEINWERPATPEEVVAEISKGVPYLKTSDCESAAKKLIAISRYIIERVLADTEQHDSHSVG